MRWIPHDLSEDNSTLHVPMLIKFHVTILCRQVRKSWIAPLTNRSNFNFLIRSYEAITIITARIISHPPSFPGNNSIKIHSKTPLFAIYKCLFESKVIVYMYIILFDDYYSLRDVPDHINTEILQNLRVAKNIWLLKHLSNNMYTIHSAPTRLDSTFPKSNKNVSAYALFKQCNYVFLAGILFVSLYER